MRNVRKAHADGTRDGCALFDDPSLAGLPADVRRDLAKICERKVYRASQTVAEIGAASVFVGIVHDGILRMQKTTQDGQEHIVGLLVPGDLFGRVFNGPLHFSVEAATDAAVHTFRRAPFEALLLRSPELERVFLLNVLDALDRARDCMMILASPKVRGRLSGFLLLLCTRFRHVDHLVTIAGQAIRVRIPLGRPDVANLLGTRVESISRALHALADDGLIDIVRPDLIDIRQIERLAEESAEPELADPASLQRIVRDLRKTAG
jgi:CRP/FNR family transcriptional regulator